MIENENEKGAFSKENKIYIKGGTRPKSTIILKKNNKNRFFYLVVILAVSYFSYKVFFNKK